MVELVDTVVSKASAEKRVGSSPTLTTKTISKQSYSQDWAEETSPPEYLLF